MFENPVFIAATKEYNTFENAVAAPYIRKSFTSDTNTEGEIIIASCGFYRLFVNGEEITKGFLAPYISNPDDYVYYDKYRVSLCAGENVIGVILGNGLLKRTHGGAIAKFKIGFEETSVEKFNLLSEQKERIAERAESYIEDGDVIAIDTGTSAHALAKMISGKQKITVVTTDLRIANLLEGYNGVSVVIAGGTVRKGFGCTVGAIANSVLMSMNVDKVFLATNSVGADGRLSTPDLEQAQIKSSLIKMGKQVFLICDSTKFTASSFAKFGTLDDVDMIITDDGIDEVILNRLRAEGHIVEIV